MERRKPFRHLPYVELNCHRPNENLLQELIEKDTKSISRIPYPCRALNYHRQTSTAEPTESHIETAARWLFMSIKWAKSLPYFAELYYPDQLSLLRQNWSKLFLFNLMSFEIVPNMGDDYSSNSKAFRELFMRWSQINYRPDILGKFDHSLNKIRRLHMDETETLLIKSLLLFNPGNS